MRTLTRAYHCEPPHPLACISSHLSLLALTDLHHHPEHHHHHHCMLRAAAHLQRDSGKRQRELLVGRIADLELAAAAGEGDVKRARAELAELEARVAAAAAAMLAPTDGGTGGGLGDVSSLLLTAASAYRRLYSSAAAAGVEVPFEAQLGNVGSLTWLEQIVVRTAPPPLPGGSRSHRSLKTCSRLATCMMSTYKTCACCAQHPHQAPLNPTPKPPKT